jgi:chromosome partitioning protein
MGTIIAVASSKGGSGKTVLTTLAASALASRGYRVAVIDADSNATFSDWAANNWTDAAKISSIVQTDHIAIIQAAQDAADDADAVLIDTAGFMSLTAASAIGVCDAVLIPVTADRGSVREALRTVQQTESLSKASRRQIIARVVRSNWTASGLAERAAMDDLTEAKVSILKTLLPPMAVFKQLTFSGIIPKTGRIASLSDDLIGELSAMKLIPRKRQPK